MRKRKWTTLMITLAMALTMIPVFSVTASANPVYYQVTVENGSTRNLTTKQDNIVTAPEGDQIYVAGNNPSPGMVFDHWELIKGKPFTGFYKEEIALSFKMPAQDISLRPVYKKATELVDTVVLTGSTAPKVNETVSYPITGLTCKTADVTLPTGINYVQWCYYPPGSYLTVLQDGFVFQKETEYYLSVSLYLDTSTGKAWAEKVNVTLDGKSTIEAETKTVGYGDMLSTLFYFGKPLSEGENAAVPTHVVNVSALNVRESPDSDSSRIGGVTKGKEVTVVETQGEWSKIIYDTGYGWVQSKYLTPIEKSSAKINPFEDVYESDNYFDAVLWAYYTDPQVTNGMDETHFGPQLTVTRGQCVTFLWRSQGCPEPSSLYNPFVDVPSTEYYYKPILWTVEKGITKGVDDTHFNPMDTLSTQHIVTFLYRTKNPGMDGWNGEAAAWAADSNGKPFGVDIEVNNTTPCPRCNVVQFLYKLSK